MIQIDQHQMNVTVKEKFDAYPQQVREFLLAIRAAIYDVARQDEIGDISETLKWGSLAIDQR